VIVCDTKPVKGGMGKGIIHLGALAPRLPADHTKHDSLFAFASPGHPPVFLKITHFYYKSANTELFFEKYQSGINNLKVNSSLVLNRRLPPCRNRMLGKENSAGYDKKWTS